MQIDDFGQAYLKFALEINKHIEGYVDAYFGPEEIKGEVDSSGPISLNQLQDNHLKLLDLIPMEDPNRHKYLLALINAMGFMIRKLNGEEFDYLEEVEGFFGIQPDVVPEDTFLKAHQALDESIPGKGSLAERIEKRNQELKIPDDLMPKAVDLIMKEIRRRTDRLIPLIQGESFDINYVKDKPWGAYNYYLGNQKSLIEINLDIEWNPLSLTHLLVHEAYPGHHTEQQLKEKHLYNGKGYLEESCLLVFTPTQIINEGIAETALEIIFSDLESFAWINEELTPALNLPESKTNEFYNKHIANKYLRNCGANAAIQYHSGKMSEEKAIEYIQTYQLTNEKRAKQMFRMATDPFWKTYVFTYSEGYRLIEEATQRKDKFPLFKRLLTEQVLPDDLMNTINSI